MTLAESEVLQLQRKAERQRIVDYVSDFRIDKAQLDDLSRWSERGATIIDVERALANTSPDVADVAALLSSAALEQLEPIASASHALTVKRFGRTMHLFAPLYLSNECVSECTYCGFQVWNRDIVRRTLTPEQVASETRYLKHLGFRHVLLVAGEHPKHVSASYVSDCIAAAADEVPHVSIEVQAWDESTYAGFVDRGCDGLVLYQETYDPRVYPDVHLKGNKRFFEWRLGAPGRAAAAGVRRLGIGALLGLNPDWRFEVLALVAHTRYLMRHAWRADLTVALPRLERAAGFDQPPHVLSDAEFTLALCALRLALPDAGIVLSTREPAALRDGLARLGVTHMSAGSRTEPGGYTEPGEAEPQFEISDERSPDAIAGVLSGLGYDPVWKDDSPVLRRGQTGAERL
jgi:2-iminoacetate synthase